MAHWERRLVGVFVGRSEGGLIVRLKSILEKMTPVTLSLIGLVLYYLI